jgi:hypothetical protein
MNTTKTLNTRAINMNVKNAKMSDVNLTDAQIDLVKMTGQDFEFNGLARVKFLFFVSDNQAEVFTGDNRKENFNLRSMAVSFFDLGGLN